MSENIPATIEKRIRDAACELTHAGVDNAQVLARHIASAATGWSPEKLLMNMTGAIPDAATQTFDELLARALVREPLSRILSEREFFGRTFQLNSQTLDPRPDSETLIEAVIELAGECGWRDRPFRFVDIGTGTGCLAITLLAQFPNATALATDISDQALTAAKANASRYSVLNRLELVNRASLEGVSGPFDLLVSNPPYIPSRQIETLAPEVKDFDPHAALDGGPDGLQIYRHIAQRLFTVIPDGWAVFEVGATMAADVASIISDGTKAQTRTWWDLEGHTRCVAVRAHCA